MYKKLLIASASASLLFFSSSAFAQTGVDDDRVSLPEGPGSLEGVGDDVNIDPNMGSMTHGIPIKLPKGFPGASPSLKLAYSSAAGSSALGMGWSMSTPSIERMTSRGVPTYDTDDLFDVSGDQLVQVGTDSGDLNYRARFEGSFVRYRWVNSGDGSEGYWIAEYPDGSRGYFGASADGSPVASARTTHPTKGTAAYKLVEKVDVYGNAVTYSYDNLNGTVPMLTGIAWVDDGGGVPLYTVEIDYATRPDHISDASRNFEEVTANRVAGIRVKYQAETIREYKLTYEAAGASGGFSRLAKVEMYGRGGIAGGDLFPIVHSFEYSQALGATCTDNECAKPYMVEMGSGLSAAANFSTGRATLIDINKDGLADLVDTNDTGAHKFFINTLTPGANGTFTHSFATPINSQASGGTGNNIQLGGVVQTFDVNGDGTSDLLNTTTGQYLTNDPAGADWGATGTLTDATALQGIDLSLARFIDLNDDKRVDLLLSTSTTTTFYENTGDTFAAQAVDPLGVAIQSDSQVQFADMNGDGLNDPVELRTDGSVRYRLNHGLGNWSAWRTVTGLSLTPTQRDRADLEDLNGDGIADVVIVGDGQIQYAINSNGESFEAMVTIGTNDIDGATIPDRGTGVTVLFADMNANGSEDVIWIRPGGILQYLELFPVRPNLLTRIENGIGFVQKIAYTTAAEEAARAEISGAPWAHKLSIPMQMVKTVDRYVKLTGNDDGTGLHEITEHLYRDGFYDGVEKQYRGFERVEVTVAGDEFHEPGRTVYRFEVGRDKPHFNGLALEVDVYSDDELLTKTTTTYGECEVAEVPTPADLLADGKVGVYWPCPLASEVVNVERETNQANWITTRTESEYDGYGNETLNAQLGRTDVEGDELFNARTYVAPTSRWLLNLTARSETYTNENGPRTRRITYYDGDDFVGLPEGQATHGFVSRVVERVDENTEIIKGMARRDAFGNKVETIAPNGSVDEANAYRTLYRYDDSGLFQTHWDELNLDDDGNPYSLRAENRYDRAFQTVIEGTKVFVVRDGQAVSSKDPTRQRLDAFGRPIELYAPGDDTDKPSKLFTYELGELFSRIITDERNELNGTSLARTVSCLDGKGRAYQKRTSIDGSTYQVGGTTIYNARGLAVEAFQPYLSQSEVCDLTAPEGTLSTTYRYDGNGRQLEVISPGDDGPITERTVFKPLMTEVYDGEDNASSNTPTRRITDGLGRLVELQRTYMENGSLQTSSVFAYYDETGSFSGYQDSDGNRHEIVTDLAGRATSITNPSFGTIEMTYDDASQVTARVDARGKTVVFEYDGMNRIKARYDADDREGTLTRWHYDFVPDGCELTECTNVAGTTTAITYAMRLGDDIVETGMDRFGYDVRRRKVFEARRIGTIADLPTRYEYDNRNRPVQITHPDGTVVTAEFDDFGRVTAIPGFVDGITYNPRNQVESVTYANGAKHTRAYDNLLRVSQAETLDGAGNVVYSLHPTFNHADAMTGVDDTSPEGALATTYGLDDWYRTTSASYADSSASYTFDELDRVLSAVIDGTTHEASYDDAKPHQLTTFGDLTYGYDAAGNLIERGGMSLDRDALGRITTVSRDGLEGRHLYGNIDRVAQLASDGTLLLYGFSNFEVRDGVANTYVGAVGRRDARAASTALAASIYDDADADGNITAADAYLGTEAAPLVKEHTLAAAAARMLAENEDEVTFIHTDLIGSAVAATDESGIIRGRQAFHAFGGLRYREGDVDAHGFTGQEQDVTTGFVHMKHRDLDPLSGRWDRFDPAFVSMDGEALNNVGEATTGYAYVANRAADQTDPSGLMKEHSIKRFADKGARLATGPTTALIEWQDPDTGATHMATFDRKLPGKWATRGKSVSGAMGSIARTAPVLGYLIRANDKRKMRMTYKFKGADEFYATQTQWKTDGGILYKMFRDDYDKKVDREIKHTKTWRALKKYHLEGRDGINIHEQRMVARFLFGDASVKLSSRPTSWKYTSDVPGMARPSTVDPSASSWGASIDIEDEDDDDD